MTGRRRGRGRGAGGRGRGRGNNTGRALSSTDAASSGTVAEPRTTPDLVPMFSPERLSQFIANCVSSHSQDLPPASATPTSTAPILPVTTQATTPYQGNVG